MVEPFAENSENCRFFVGQLYFLCHTFCEVPSKEPLKELGSCTNGRSVDDEFSELGTNKDFDDLSERHDQRSAAVCLYP